MSSTIPVKPIKTEADYDAALAVIDRLWNAEPGTAAADRLEVLVTLVEAYEAQHWSIDPPDLNIPLESLVTPAAPRRRPRRAA